MELKKVESSNISQIGYEKEQQLTFNSNSFSVLRIVFTSGSIYDYYKVPEEIYTEFVNSKSIGKFFWANIKDKFNFEKVK